MKRSKPAVLGLVALALATMSVLVASGAQAANIGQFTCFNTPNEEHVHCTGHGEQRPTHDNAQTTHTFLAGFATVSCETATFELTTDADGTSETAPTKPTYENCTANPGGLPARVETNGCEYEFHIEAEGGLTPGDYNGSADIVNCAENESITVTITENEEVRCTVHIPEQMGIAPIYFRNMSGTLNDVTVEARNATVETKFTPGPGRTLLGGCGVLSESAHSKYTGNTTVSATNTTKDFIGTAIGLI